MKRYISLLLALCLVLPLTACGGSDAPAQTTAAPTQATTEAPTEAPTEVPTEAPTEAPTEPPIVYEPYELSDGQCYESVVRSMGFVEFFPKYHETYSKKIYNLTGAYATPTSLEVTENGFRMELDCGEYVPYQKGVQETGDWVLYGSKAEGLGNLSGLDFNEYPLSVGLSVMTSSGNTSGPVDGIRFYQEKYHLCGKTNANREVANGYLWAAIYFPETGNLYNFVRKFEKKLDAYSAPEYPHVFLTSLNQFHPTVNTVPYEDSTIQLMDFVIHYGHRFSIYQVKVGMTISEWIDSEWNIDGWTLLDNQTVLSPDGKYSFTVEHDNYWPFVLGWDNRIETTELVEESGSSTDTSMPE